MKIKHLRIGRSQRQTRLVPPTHLQSPQSGVQTLEQKYIRAMTKVARRRFFLFWLLQHSFTNASPERRGQTLASKIRQMHINVQEFVPEKHRGKDGLVLDSVTHKCGQKWSSPPSQACMKQILRQLNLTALPRRTIMCCILLKFNTNSLLCKKRKKKKKPHL